MTGLKPEEITLSAVDAFNSLGKAHNAQLERFGAEGLSGSEATLAAYMAIRVMLARLEGPVNEIVAPESWPAVETVIRVMCKQVETRGARASA